jgi:hypothetical protein
MARCVRVFSDAAFLEGNAKSLLNADRKLQIANGIRLVGGWFRLDEVVRLSKANCRIHIAEFRNPIWDDQLQATARPFGVPDFTLTERTRAGQRAIF